MGLLGVSKPKTNNVLHSKILKEMCDFFTINPKKKADSLFIDNNLGVVDYNSNMRNSDDHLTSSDILIWIDGYIYNKQKFPLYSYLSDKEFFKRLYSKFGDFSFLKDVDGIFVVVLYDKKINKLFVINDRYGFKELFYTIRDNTFYFTSELKAFIKLSTIKLKVNTESLDCFLEFGHHLGNETWFENVNLIPMASILTWDLKNSNLKNESYWSWSEVKEDNLSISEDEAIEELGRLFHQAVNSRIYGKSGATLSGGLDSRAIVAAADLAKLDEDFHTITFGLKNSLDMHIAKEVSRIKNVHHLQYVYDNQNWLNNRIQALWYSDGNADFIHTHGIECLNLFASRVNHNLNGFAGDLVLGGSYLKEDMLYHNGVLKDVLLKYIGKKKKSNFDIEQYLDINKYLNCENYDFFFIENRVRRFTYQGLKISSSQINNHIPFFDYELFDFIYSIPKKFRYNSYIYKKMLLKKYPDFFLEIPWQKTGELISGEVPLDKKWGNFTKEFVDYAELIKKEPAITFIEELLLDKNAMYTEYISFEMVKEKWRLHKNNLGKYSIDISRYISFEIMLQQFFNKKYIT